MSTIASSAGAIDMPSRFGHSTPKPSRSHGNAVNPMQSVPVIASAAVCRPNSWRTSSRQDSGHSTTVAAAVTAFAASGMLAPEDSITSDARSCHAAG